jgi:hypothetical protein
MTIFTEAEASMIATTYRLLNGMTTRVDDKLRSELEHPYEAGMVRAFAETAADSLFHLMNNAKHMLGDENAGHALDTQMMGSRS